MDSGEPAIMVCHWPGIYYNGEKLGFKIFQKVVSRLEQKYGTLNWMKNSEIAKYWAAKELTKIDFDGKKLNLQAPFAADNFTLEINTRKGSKAVLSVSGQNIPLERVKSRKELKAGCFYKHNKSVIACFNLQKGKTTLTLS